MHPSGFEQTIFLGLKKEKVNSISKWPSWPIGDPRPFLAVIRKERFKRWEIFLHARALGSGSAALTQSALPLAPTSNLGCLWH